MRIFLTSVLIGCILGIPYWSAVNLIKSKEELNLQWVQESKAQEERIKAETRALFPEVEK